MEELDEIEQLVWEWISKENVGKENAIDQKSLFIALGFYSNDFDNPSTFRELRSVMRKLKQKRPILTSLKDSPGYYKPAKWEEVLGCLARRKYTALRMLNLNKKILEVCKSIFPEQVSKQLSLFDKENESILRMPEECEKS